MVVLTNDLEQRLQRIPPGLKAEFPNVPLDAIEHDVDEDVSKLIENAHFPDFVPPARLPIRP